MPIRNIAIANNQIYHVFNKTIDRRKLFRNNLIADRFLYLLRYYRSRNADIRYSHYDSLTGHLKSLKDSKIDDPSSFIVDILQYCLMPNHFHLLLRQRSTNGISFFMSNILNSTTRYYNTLYERKGPLFLTQFRSKHIASTEYLTEISRYIHLNPYKAGLTPTLSALIGHPYTSLSEYVLRNPSRRIVTVETNSVLGEFNYSRDRYYRFIFGGLQGSATSEVEMKNRFLE